MVTMEQRVSGLEEARQDLPTKTDLAEMEKRLIAEMEKRLIAEMDGREKRLLAEMDGREKRLLLEMQTRVLQSENSIRKEMSSMVKWVAGLQLITIGATVAGVAVLLELLR